MNLTPDESIDEPLRDDASTTAQSLGLSTARVASLTDGVFAIVLTLLVLDLHAPAATSQAQLLSALRDIVPQLILFVVSFAIVAVFWYGHHMEMHWIVRSDRVHLGITLAFLLTISFVPFSASLLGKNPQLPIAATIYGANLFLAGVVRCSHWTYATNGSRLTRPGLEPEFARHVKRVFFVVAVLYLVAAGLSWLNTIIAIAAFVLIPLLYVRPARHTRHLTSLRPLEASPQKINRVIEKEDFQMDIGFLMAPTAQSGDLAGAARLIESLGYESLWIPEHPVIPVNMKTPFPFTHDNKLPDHYARWADPFIGLTVAATVTTKIKLGTGICLLPEREPLITAKTVASLDLFSGGRLILGVGAGWLREETEVMGAKFGTRWKRTRETVEAMRVLWSKREASYEGEIVRFPPVRCEPKPLQKPHPPVILGAHGPKALERVARTYDGWMPLTDSPEEMKRDAAMIRKLAAEHGRKPESIQISPLVDPKENGPSADDMKRYRDAGVSRIVLLSQKTVAATADGKAPELARHFAQVVERAQGI